MPSSRTQRNKYLVGRSVGKYLGFSVVSRLGTCEFEFDASKPQPLGWTIAFSV